MCDPSNIIKAGLSIGGALLSSKSAKKAAARNAAIANTLKADNSRIFTDAQSDIEGLLKGASEQGQGLIDYVSSQNARRFQDTFTANQGVLDGNTQAITATLRDNRATNQAATDKIRDETAGLLTKNRDLNAGLLQSNRDANVGLFDTTGAANEADIRDFSGRAESAINSARTANEALFQPYVSSGRSASDAINALLGLSGDASSQAAAFKRWADSTGYQYALDSGRQEIEASHAANGMLESGATLKALQDRGQQVAQGYFGNYLAALQGQATQGLSAAGSLAGSNSHAGDALSSLYQNTSGQLSSNRNWTTQGVAGANDAYTAGSISNNNNYASGAAANSNNWLTGTRGINDLYATGLADNIRNYMQGTINNSNQLMANNYMNDAAYMSSSLSNIDRTTSGLANNRSTYATNMAGLNTNVAELMSGVNNAKAAATNTLMSGVADAVNRIDDSKINDLFGWKTPIS